MRDILFAQVRGLAQQWEAEAQQRRRRTQMDLAADAIASCAGELRAVMDALEADTRPLTVAQFAKREHVEKATVRKWILRGELTAEKAASGDWEIPRSARRVRRRATSAASLQAAS